ncbi:MAG: alpha-1,2-fucosyltransferase [Coriobacteriia bacterium]|nr:alpha-1,2-fucosyltransferase [Coriobacteriia bacterium]
MNKEVAVYLFGGLGNQLFQYATASALSHRLQVQLVLDTSWFAIEKRGSIDRPLLLRQFPHIKGRIAELGELRFAHALTPGIGNRYAQVFKKVLYNRTHYTNWSSVRTEPHYDYWSALENATPPLFIYGYYQNERYFGDYAQQIRAELSLARLDSPRFSELSFMIAQDRQKSVAIHVRRGDYVQNGRQLGTCTPAYYRQAVGLLANQMSEEPRLYVFSDEPDWVRENLIFGKFDTRYIDIDEVGYDTSIEDLALMSLCHHHIIANSSYSWWGAWLGEARDGTTIAPARWFPNANPSLTPVPARWLCVGVSEE